MEDMSTVRRTLKEWEKAFFTVHQRKPSKTDISDAPDKIKGLYRAYYAAKKTTESKPEELTQHSSTSAERQDTSKYGHTSSDANIDLSSPQSLASVWGPELNRNKTTSDSETTAAEKKSSGNLNRFGEKLSAHSCSASPSAGATSVIKKKANICRVDPQSATQVPKPISPSVDSQGTRDQTKVHSSKSDSSDFRLQGELFKKAFRLSTGKKRSISDDVQIPSKFLNHDKPRRQFSLGQKTDADGLNDFNMELGNSDSLKSSGFASGERFHDSAPFDLNTSAGGMIQPGNLSPEQTIGHKLIESKNHNTATSRTEIIISSKNLASSGDNVDSDAGKLSGSVTKDNSRGVGGPTRKSRNSHKSISSLVESAQPYKIPEDDGRPSPDVFAFDANEAGSSEKGGETETFEPGFDTDKGSKVVSKQAKKRKAPVKRKASSAATRPSKKKKICDHDEIENEECDPGSGTSPQNEAAAAKSQPLVTAKMARKPSTSAACKSENFVRLNMKAKKFVRKGARLTGAQWKRKQWKQKMAARSQSFGSDKCFKCGQSGHWANKCPQKGQVSQPGLGIDVTPVDENDFPSLKTAALMARGVQASGGDEVGSDDELAVEAMVVREKHEPDVKPVSATPLSQLISDIGSEMKKGLDKFGFTSFRPGQQETIRRILHGQSTLVILSTGGGKSLCYQLPAYLYAQHARGITLVVSPLVSLMEDQITGLPPGVRGACLNSNMTPAQRDGVLSDVNDGKVHFLLVSPEAVVGGGGRGQGSFPSADKLPPIFFACIDEVHCLSEWSHNFRPSYLRLCKVLREKYGVNCFLGLTATATSSTARDVVRHLDISDMDAATIRGSPVPPNLCLSVSRDENKDEALVSLLQGKRFSACGSVIIYCTRREQVERVATLIRTCLQTRTEPKKKRPKGKKASLESSCETWTVESYHAGLTPAQRKRVQKAFMSGNVRVVVATVAFGMGLDKADVRGIIHYNMPKSFESYVQEIGRAGRDGKVSHCHLFLDSQGRDVGELQRHTFGNSVDRYTLKKLLQKVFTACKCREVQQLRASKIQTGVSESEGEKEPTDRVCPGHERALPIQGIVQELDVREEGVETLLCYLELHAPHLIANLSPVYATCQLQCYGGPAQLQAVARKCPPVAVAIARHKMRGKSFSTAASVQFPVVDVSDSMGWDSGPVKRELRTLQWNFGEGGARKSGVMVTFTDLAFHVRACGDVSDCEMDDLLDYLHERVTRQERAELAQLALLGQRLRSVSHKNFWMCSDQADESRSQTLKKHLDDYFEDKSDDRLDHLELPAEEVDGSSLAQLVSDIRQFIHVYGPEHVLTARAIARVFHGIDSPRFPATTWGRVRRFWRSHLHVHFNIVLREASTLLLAMR